MFWIVESKKTVFYWYGKNEFKYIICTILHSYYVLLHFNNIIS